MVCEALTNNTQDSIMIDNNCLKVWFEGIK
jgi:hypothetical protein